MSNRSTLVEHHLKELRLPTFLREYRKLAARAAENVDHPDYLLRLSLELIDRHQRMVQRRIRAARFPASKAWTPSTSVPSVNKQLVMELARCEYIEHRENVIAVGNSGTGKTHVALGLGRLPKGNVRFWCWRPETIAGCSTCSGNWPASGFSSSTSWASSPSPPPVRNSSSGLQPALRTGLRPGHHQPALRLACSAPRGSPALCLTGSPTTFTSWR